MLSDIFNLQYIKNESVKGLNAFKIITSANMTSHMVFYLTEICKSLVIHRTEGKKFSQVTEGRLFIHTRRAIQSQLSNSASLFLSQENTYKYV